MARAACYAPGGLVYHAINRGVARLPLFEKLGDYQAFEPVLEDAVQKHPTRILGWCLMPNPCHFVIGPREDGERRQYP